MLAKNCTEAAYIRLVEALCSEHQIKLLKVHEENFLWSPYTIGVQGASLASFLGLRIAFVICSTKSVEGLEYFIT